MTCRTLEQIQAAGRKAGTLLAPITQDQADLIAAILAPHQGLVIAA